MFQRFHLLAWPRASRKQRLLATVLAAIFLVGLVQQWPHRHDDLAVARWMAWFFVVNGCWFGTQALAVVLAGRLTGTYASIFHRAPFMRMTLPQMHRHIARERQASKGRTRLL